MSDLKDDGGFQQPFIYRSVTFVTFTAVKYIKYLFLLTVACAIASPFASLANVLVVEPLIFKRDTSGEDFSDPALLMGMVMFVFVFGPVFNKVLFLCVLAPYLTALEHFKKSSFVLNVLGVAVLSALGPRLSKTFNVDNQAGDFLVNPITIQFCVQGIIAGALIYGLQSILRMRRARAQQERVRSE